MTYWRPFGLKWIGALETVRAAKHIVDRVPSRTTRELNPSMWRLIIQTLRIPLRSAEKQRILECDVSSEALRNRRVIPNGEIHRSDFFERFP